MLELTVFMPRHNIYWYAKISLVLPGEEAKTASQELEGDLSQNTPAHTLTRSFSFLSSLEGMRSLIKPANECLY